MMRSQDSTQRRRRPVGRVALALLVMASTAGCAGGAAQLAGRASGSPGTDSSTDTPRSLAPCVTGQARVAPHGGLPDLRLDCFGEGPSIDIARLAGPAVVNLWASWCYPCRAEMPLLQKASAGTRIRIVGVDTNDGAASARKFITNTVHATYEELSDPTGKLALDLHAPGLPYTVAIGRGGDIVWHKAGKLTGADLASAVNAARKAG